jgi:PAS domain S-box-containing protein
LQWEAVTRRLDGEPVDVLLSMRPARRTAASDSLILSAVDITERKRYYEALRQSENRFRTLFNSAASGIALVTVHGRYLRVNDALCALLGYTREEMERANWRDITHPDDVELTDTMISEMLQSQSIRPLEKRYIHKDGRIIWGLINVGLNLDDNGSPLHYVVQVQDITWMKEVQAEMRLKEERHRQIFEADLSGFFIADPSGKVLLGNQVFAGILGFASVAEVVGRNISPHYRKPGAWSGWVEALRDGKKIDNPEVELLRSSGESVTVLCNGIGSFDEQGRLAEIQGHMINISGQKKLEMQLVRAQKMEAIGLMAGGVAHDLNNILSGIINYPELMLATLGPDSHLRKPLVSIRESGLRAAAVVADLLTVARGAANVREVHNIHALAEEYLDSPECSKLRSLYPKIAIDLLCVSENTTILCSPVHVKKCLMNLVTNAMEAIETSGRVQLIILGQQQMEKKDGVEIARDYVVVKVIDDGPGISEKDRERIFEPFYTKKVMGKSGTGLGLAIVWNTVQDHGGKIQVTGSELGTSFSLFFPRHDKTAVEPGQEQDGIALRGDGERILVVDDEALLRDIAYQILTSLGYTVDTVESGEEALAFLQDNRVDLVLLDMFMDPGMNGCRAYERISEFRPGQKAIIASGYSKSDDVKKAMRLGVGSFIEKPYSMEQLGRVVHRELHRPSGAASPPSPLLRPDPSAF